MFYFAMIIGLLAIICAYFQLLPQFIFVFLVACLAEFIYQKYLTSTLMQERSKTSDEISEILNKAMDRQQEQAKEKQEKADKIDFLSEGMIPVRVDQETGVYMVLSSDLIKGIEIYMTKMEEEMMKKLAEFEKQDSTK